MKILDIDNYDKNNFSIKEIDGKFNINYENKIFFIDPNTGFKNCNLYANKFPHKIKIHVDKNEDHQKFKKLIICIYDYLSEYIEKRDDICVSHIINPFYKINNTDTLFTIINKNTIIKNLDNQEIINVNELSGKVFNMYPMLYSPNFSVYDDRIYMNLTLHTIFVKIIKKDWDGEIFIDYKKIVEKMKKLE